MIYVAAAAFALIMALTVHVVQHADRRDARHPPRVFAYPGQVVTTPEGNYVCTIAREMRTGEPVQSQGWCDLWAIGAPAYGSKVSDSGSWARADGGHVQFFVNGKWVP